MTIELKKTPQEIAAHIAAIADSDWMGTTRSDLIDYLPFDLAKEHLKPEATQAMWDEREVKSPLDTAKDYLEFAWGKANDCRGLSAGRSLDHLKAWLWLAGFEQIVHEHFADHERYGKFQLVIASELTGFDWRNADNGEWVNSESGPSLDTTSIVELADSAKAIAETALVSVRQQAWKGLI